MASFAAGSSRRSPSSSCVNSGGTERYGVRGEERELAVGYVTHSIVADFAAEKVNLKRDAVTTYRQQVKRLCNRLKDHIDAHPDYGFVKTRHSGSLAKGTALSTL